MSTKCSVTETVKHFWVSGCKFSRCLRPGFCFSHFHYSRCPPEVFTKPIMNSVGVVGQVYPFPFSLLLPGAFLTYEALSWMAPLHFHDLLVQPAAWRRLWNTGSVQICERLFCVLVFFTWITDVYGWDNVPCKARGRLAIHAAFRKQKSLTCQLRLDQWDKQPASHSKATCLVCHFSNCAEWLPLTLKWWGNSASTCVVLQM